MSTLIKTPSEQVKAFCAWRMYRDGVGVKNISAKLKIPLNEVRTTLYILGEHPRHSRFRDRDSSREERIRLASLFN
jgi:transcription initiation factor IIE alpha subunit